MIESYFIIDIFTHKSPCPEFTVDKILDYLFALEKKFHTKFFLGHKLFALGFHRRCTSLYQQVDLLTLNHLILLAAWLPE